MTHIVYDGERLFADRKCYNADATVLEVDKIRSAIHGDWVWHWAFSGSYAACELGDEVFESGCAPEKMERARTILPADEAQVFSGVLVKVPTSPSQFNRRQVYLISPIGLMSRVELGNTILCAGAMAKEIQVMYDTLKFASTNMGVSIGELLGLNEDDAVPGDEIEVIIRRATRNTYFGQDGYQIDRLLLKPE